jgi:hypothetical protein
MSVHRALSLRDSCARTMILASLSLSFLPLRSASPGQPASESAPRFRLPPHFVRDGPASPSCV